MRSAGSIWTTWPLQRAPPRQGGRSTLRSSAPQAQTRACGPTTGARGACDGRAWLLMNPGTRTTPWHATLPRRTRPSTPRGRSSCAAGSRPLFHGLLYTKTKGMAEEAVKAVGIPQASIFRFVHGRGARRCGTECVADHAACCAAEMRWRSRMHVACLAAPPQCVGLEVPTRPASSSAHTAHTGTPHARTRRPGLLDRGSETRGIERALSGLVSSIDVAGLGQLVVMDAVEVGASRQGTRMTMRLC